MRALSLRVDRTLRGAGHTCRRYRGTVIRSAGITPRTPTRLADGLGAEGAPSCQVHTISPKELGPPFSRFREIRRLLSVSRSSAKLKRQSMPSVKGSTAFAWRLV